MQAELVRLPGGSTLPVVSATVAGIELDPPTIPWTSEVSISSVRAPVMNVRLRGVDGRSTQSLYQCPASTGPGCLVELNGPALQNLLGTAPVAMPTGTYDFIDVLYCPEPFPSPAVSRVFATGTATIGGTTYYTRTAGTLGTTGPAQPVSIDYVACGASYPISPPLVITDSTTATTVVRLYFDILDIAAAALPMTQTNPMWVPGVCTAVSPLGSTPFLCVAYPDVIAVVGTNPPVIEHYRVNSAATVGLVFDPGSDAFLGGYLRRYAVEDQLWNPGFAPDGGIGSLTANGDGTYRLQQRNHTGGEPGALFPAWRRATHSGTVSAGGGSTPYSAVRLP